MTDDYFIRPDNDVDLRVEFVRKAIEIVCSDGNSDARRLAADIIAGLDAADPALHTGAPVGYRCADCTMDGEPCPTCYAVWWQKRHPHSRQVNVIEDEEFTAVRTLYRKFGFLESATPTHLTRRKLADRIQMMNEELFEFTRAALAQDMEGMFDALLDLVVFAKGTASMMGLPWRAGFDDVNRANMAKVRGPTKRGQRDDITKPPGWVGPRTAEILKAAGYDRSKFEIMHWGALTETAETIVPESYCLDDPKTT